MLLGKLRAGSAALVVAVCLSVAGQAALAVPFTVTTFSDPAIDATDWMFKLEGDSFFGRWDGLGLTLETPGLSAPDFENVTFMMAPVTIESDGTTSTAGQIDFFDESGGDLYSILFSSAQLHRPYSFAANELLTLQDVQFVGPIIDTPLVEEAFSFGFANQLPTDNGFTGSASFTSSAMPEPGTLALLMFAGLGFLHRSRRAAPRD